MTVIDRLRETGIRRLGSVSSGFHCRSAAGGPVGEAYERRIALLAIPPAWSDVFISAAPNAAVQAVGRDRAGRWQYRYSARQRRIRERRKRERLLVLMKALPGLRSRVALDLRRSGLTRERVIAGMVQILLRCFLRPGSQVYARDNGTFGIATLRPSHVRIEGQTVNLSYPGKGRKLQLHRVDDTRVVRVVRSLLRHPSRELFRYRTADGEWVNVRRRHINEYIREVTGARITAKDFRTWAGTLVGACALARVGYPDSGSKRAVRSGIASAMRETAAALGNTPSVCRDSYVCPGVLEAFARGVVLSNPPSPEKLIRAPSKTLAELERRLSSIV